jgi:transposase-like protein
MSKEKKRYTSEQKVEMLREVLVDGVKVSDVCEKYGVTPTSICIWQKELFENAVTLFQNKNGEDKAKDKAIADLKHTLSIRDSLISEIVSENIQLKKKQNGAI